MSTPTPLQEIVGRPLPDIALLTPTGTPFSLGSRVGIGPLALFMYIRNGTPG